MSAVIQLTDLKKNYGSVQALRGINLSIPRGSVYGVIGPNGAGKTTLFSLILGYLQPTSGRVQVLEQPPSQLHTLRGKVSALPQDADLPGTVSVDEALRFFAALNGQGAVEADIKRVLEVVDLASSRTAKIRTLSHGMKKRVYVAMALLGKPELIILDEPTAGLDPKHAHALMQMLTTLRAQDCTLVVSSHNLNELESVCSHAVLLRQGEVVKDGTLDSVRHADEELFVTLSPGPFDVQALQAKLPGMSVNYSAEQSKLTLRYKPSAERSADDLSAEAVAAVVACGGKVRSVERGQSLLQTYLALDKA